MRDSLWFETLARADLDALTTSDDLPRTADAVLVGAGLAGICTAYSLVRAGMRDVAVLDREHALSQASGANAGGLWYAHYFPQLGPLTDFALASSHLFDELAEDFAFDLRRNGVVELVDDLSDEALAARVAATSQAGLSTETLPPAELREREPALNPDAGPALFFPTDGNVNPSKLAAALIRYCRSHGARFCFDYPVEQLQPEVATPRGNVDCGFRVITAGAWTPLVTDTIGWEPPIKPIRGTLLAINGLPPTLRHTVMKGDLYYWQVLEGHLAGGGTVEDAGFEYTVPEASVERIRTDLDALIPSVRNHETALAWSGFRPYCEDAVPVIGAVPEARDTFVAAGHFKKGVMLAPATGQLLADLITSGTSELEADVLRPERFALAETTR